MKKFLLRTAVITAAAALAWYVGGAILLGIGPAYATFGDIAVALGWVVAMYKNAMKSIDDSKNPPSPPSAGLAIESKPSRQKQNQRQRDDLGHIQEAYRAPGQKKKVGRWGKKARSNDYQRAA